MILIALLQYPQSLQTLTPLKLDEEQMPSMRRTLSLTTKQNRNNIENVTQRSIKQSSPDDIVIASQLPSTFGETSTQTEQSTNSDGNTISAYSENFPNINESQLELLTSEKSDDKSENGSAARRQNTSILNSTDTTIPTKDISQSELGNSNLQTQINQTLERVPIPMLKNAMFPALPLLS